MQQFNLNPDQHWRTNTSIWYITESLIIQNNTAFLL